MKIKNGFRVTGFAGPRNERMNIRMCGEKSAHAFPARARELGEAAEAASPGFPLSRGKRRKVRVAEENASGFAFSLGK
jgi:hypothetical protein